VITILSWNILQGGGSRLQSQLASIATAKPTICVFSEYRNNESGNALRLGLLKLGYRHQHVSNAKRDDNSVIIASMIPFSGELYPKADLEFSQNMVAAHFDAFSVLGLYLPHKKHHALFDYIQNSIIKSDQHFILTGDFNSGINGIDQVGNSFWYEDKMKLFPKFNYADCFRYKNGDVQEYSWYSHQGNGYRYDHTYVHDDLLPIIKECKYLHAWRQDGLSDHSPMWIEIG
jgi:exodeoxyribonuclease III